MAGTGTLPGTVRNSSETISTYVASKKTFVVFVEVGYLMMRKKQRHVSELQRFNEYRFYNI